jgi:hypothetical protein
MFSKKVYMREVAFEIDEIKSADLPLQWSAFNVI